ncbi:unnamed protein product, partial [Symbiodinium sp. CCMP2456]
TDEEEVVEEEEEEASHHGERGKLFQDAVEFMHQLRARLPKHRFGFLYENVDMDQAAAKPRLWWTSVDWTRFPADPDDGTPLEWAKKGRWERLRLASARRSTDTFDLGGWTFHPSVATGRRLMPCATTPAPTEEGRPKPRATRGKTDLRLSGCQGVLGSNVWLWAIGLEFWVDAHV